MQTYTEYEALSVIFDKIKELWDEVTWVDLGFDSKPPIIWPNTIDTSEEGSFDDSVFKVLIENHSISKVQKSLGPKGSRLYEQNNLLVVKVLDPTRDGLQKSYNIYSMFVEAFQGSKGSDADSGIDFFEVSKEDRGIERSLWLVTNIIIPYKYCEVR